MDIAWTEQLSVGNTTLDCDNKKLFGLIRDIDRAIEGGELFAVSRALKQLTACMSQCFLNEELFANALNIPFALHKVTHQNVLTEIDFTRHDVEKGGVTSVSAREHYAQVLQTWLVNHITEHGMLMKPALLSRPYDFKIDGAVTYR